MFVVPIPVIPLRDITGDDSPSTIEYLMPDSMLVDPPSSPHTFVVGMETATGETKPLPYRERNIAQGVSFDTYIGQEAVKDELRIFMDAALHRMEALPHTLFASSLPGVGKTTLALAVADYMGGRLFTLTPPFDPETLYDILINQMEDFDIIFIDEIHKLADSGPRHAENLLTALEEGKLFLEDAEHILPPFTLIGATTDADKLPPAVLSRFMIKPFFERYTLDELALIAETNFCRKFEVDLPQDVLNAIAGACRDTPRVARELVIAARALQDARGAVTPESLLKFKVLEPDGMTRMHVAYITALYQFGKKEVGEKNNKRIEYTMGEKTIATQLREGMKGILDLERFLIDRNLIDLTQRGRRLTDRGIVAARDYVARGKGHGVS